MTSHKECGNYSITNLGFFETWMLTVLAYDVEILGKIFQFRNKAGGILMVLVAIFTLNVHVLSIYKVSIFNCLL